MPSEAEQGPGRSGADALREEQARADLAAFLAPRSSSHARLSCMTRRTTNDRIGRQNLGMPSKEEEAAAAAQEENR